MTDRSPRMAVIGGGAVGLTAAADLADRGADVTLFERSPIEGRNAGSTARAAGVLNDVFPTERERRTAARSLERFREFARGDDVFSLTDLPYVWFATRGDDDLAAGIRATVEGIADSADVSLVDPEELAADYPALDCSDVATAAVARTACYADPAAYPPMMAERAREAGVEIRPGLAARVETEPPGVTTDDGTTAFDGVLVAAGAWTKRLLADAGIPIAMKPYRVQALTVEPTPTAAGIPMVFDPAESYYFRPYEGGLLIGGGLQHAEQDPDDWEREADERFIEGMGAHLERRLVDAAFDLRDAWAGLCTGTPDHEPLLGEIRPGVYVATGWQGHGFMRAPAHAELIAAQMLGGEGVAEYDPRRFDGSEEFEITAGIRRMAVTE